MIKGIFFDFDNTLFYTGGTGGKILRNILEKKGTLIDEQEYNSLDGLNMKEKIAILFPENKNELFEEWSKEFDKQFILDVKPFESTIKTIKSLNKSGLKLFIFSTKFNKYILQALKKYKLDPYFVEIIGKDAIKKPKPNPMGVNQALKKYNFKRTEVILVGDSKVDLESANNAKLKFIQIRPLAKIETIKEAYIVINDLSELEEKVLNLM